MTRLRDSTSIEHPAKEAQGALTRFFAALRGSGDVARLRLHVLDRDVHVEARCTPNEGGFNGPINVAWWPEGGTVFPRFWGTLLIAAESGCCSSLELEGEYTAPLGAAGQIFDVTIGHRIAAATACELLAGIKAAISGGA